MDEPRIQLQIAPDGAAGMWYVDLQCDMKLIRRGIYRRAEVPQVIREGMEIVAELIMTTLDASDRRAR